MRSGKQNAAVEMRWAELLDENMPQELHRSIEEQKAACAEIVASKVLLYIDDTNHTCWGVAARTRTNLKTVVLLLNSFCRMKRVRLSHRNGTPPVASSARISHKYT